MNPFLGMYPFLVSVRCPFLGPYLVPIFGPLLLKVKRRYPFLGSECVPIFGPLEYFLAAPPVLPVARFGMVHRYVY